MPRTTTIDASAILAYLNGEHGADVVESELSMNECVISAVNWSEVAQKIRRAGADWPLARATLRSLRLDIEPVTVADAEAAAAMWAPNTRLSLADRCCLALGQRLGTRILTADTEWGDADPITQIR